MIGIRKEDALAYLSYHAPDGDTRYKHEVINASFQELLENIWDSLPEGPGKTVAIRAIGYARMECNSAISNQGQ